MSLKISPQPASVHNHDRFEVTAAGLGRYTIDVSLPAAYAAAEDRYPVILVTDGNAYFDLVRAIVHGGDGDMIAPAIVVGVGYPADEGAASFYARRNHDFHGPWAMTDPLGMSLHEIFNGLKSVEGRPDLEMRAGGFDRFLGFLRDELLPQLAQAYRIDLAGRHTLVGHSSGGHFVLRALYDPTSPFSRYLCISPSFGAGDGAIQQAEAAYAAAHQDLAADIFVCCGAVEVDDAAMYARCRFGGGVAWVAEQFAIRQWPSARLHWEVMNLESHTSIVPRALAAGLRSVHRLRPGVHRAEIAQALADTMAKMGIVLGAQAD